MTKSEVIKDLKNSIVSYDVNNINNITCDLTRQAIDIAIDCIAENEKYKRIIQAAKILEMQGKNLDVFYLNSRDTVNNVFDENAQLKAEIARLKEQYKAVCKAYNVNVSD